MGSHSCSVHITSFYDAACSQIETEDYQECGACTQRDNGGGFFSCVSGSAVYTHYANADCTGEESYENWYQSETCYDPVPGPHLQSHTTYDCLSSPSANATS